MTAEEIIIKNKVFPNTVDTDAINPTFRKYMEFCIKSCMRDYAKLKCQEQRQLCADNVRHAEKGDNDFDYDYMVISKDSIINSPEPEI